MQDEERYLLDQLNQIDHTKACGPDEVPANCSN